MSKREAISLAIVSSDCIFADALEIVLSSEEGLEVIVTNREDWTAPRWSKVDVVLIDATMGRDEALATTSAIRERFESARLMMIGLEREDETVLDFIEAGALGYVLQDTAPAALVKAIRLLHGGRTVCSPHIATAALSRITVLSQTTLPPANSAPDDLTNRELELLSLIAQGLGNKEIARVLRITAQTVKNHVHHILLKLGVHRRRDAVRIAYRRGLLRES
jgi:DNA-binding NarL/FixJ family response regulator